MAMLKTAVILSFFTFSFGAQNYAYMDSDKSCGSTVYLTDDDQFKLQTLQNVSADNHGYFPCYHIYYSFNEVVCLSPMLISISNCTMRLNYYMFNGDVPNVKDLTPQTTFDCNSDFKAEWCSPKPANLIVELEKLEPVVNLKTFFFLFDVSRVTSGYRSTFMFSNCGVKMHLHHSEVHILMINGSGSCTKTFTYYEEDRTLRDKSRLCLKFIRWPAFFSCSAFDLHLYKHENDRFSTYRSYTCSESKPKDLCIDSEFLTLKVVSKGNLEKVKGDFELIVWDNHDEVTAGTKLSTTTIVIIVICVSLSFVVLIVILVRCCCKCGGGTRTRTPGGPCPSISWPSLPSFPSLPSLPSAPSLPSLAGDDD